jgi:hypothetical protein
MKKLKVEEPVLPSHNARMRMFQQLCVFPRVDSTVFAKIAKQFGLGLFSFGNASSTMKVDSDAMALFDALDPLYSTALRSFGSKLTELDEMGLGRGIETKWAVCGVSFVLLQIYRSFPA